MLTAYDPSFIAWCALGLLCAVLCLGATLYLQWRDERHFDRMVRQIAERDGIKTTRIGTAYHFERAWREQSPAGAHKVWCAFLTQGKACNCR